MPKPRVPSSATSSQGSSGVAVILAARHAPYGKSRRPAEIMAARQVLHHVQDAATGVFDRAILVVGPELAGHPLPPPPHRVLVQQDRLGSAHAALQAAPLLAGYRGDVAVIRGDLPALSPRSLVALRAARAEGAHLVILALRPPAPSRLARIVACPDTGLVERVVPWVEATAAERAIGLCDAGVVCARGVDLLRWLRAVRRGPVRPAFARHELRFTDIVAIAREEGRQVVAVEGPADELTPLEPSEAPETEEPPDRPAYRLPAA